MALKTTLTRSATAAVINTDTVLLTPANGVRYKLVGFSATNEGAAQAAGMNFELRVGATIVAIVGYDSGAAPIGQSSKPAVLAHEIIGDGVTTVVARNLTALAVGSNAAYVLVQET